MKQIIKIRTLKSDFGIEDLWSAYLFSTFFLYMVKNNPGDLKSVNIVVGKELLPDLQERVIIALNNLLKDSYLEPSINELQKHPTRFETILLNGRKYKVNYRLSEVGRMAYAIYCLINFINDAILEGNEIYLEFN
ncbi:hypothetical protein HGH92_30830 [Chitinophaga varians]|uniref:Uncharacterized protein n=1 Tax=Chitinophaga varians TaxID=2202339 RepID=A0A847S6M2_9BACT|nr:hypothetical protein [Chitinophaga varians]NLR68738.1 hypothetical protein [Chitinophaga varians]